MLESRSLRRFTVEDCPSNAFHTSLLQLLHCFNVIMIPSLVPKSIPRSLSFSAQSPIRPCQIVRSHTEPIVEYAVTASVTWGVCSFRSLEWRVYPAVQGATPTMSYMIVSGSSSSLQCRISLESHLRRRTSVSLLALAPFRTALLVARCRRTDLPALSVSDLEKWVAPFSK